MINSSTKNNNRRKMTMSKINTKNWKVKVSGKREWDSKTQQLAEVEMTLEDFL